MALEQEIEDMQYEAEILRSMTLAAYDGIYNSISGYEEFDGQLYAVFCLAHEHSEHMKALKDKAYRQKEKNTENLRLKRREELI